MLNINLHSIKALIDKKFYPPSQLVTVVLPVYKSEPSITELISLKQCAAILKNYPITIISLKELNLQYYIDFFADYSIVFQIIRFDNFYFANIDGYNKLLLSEMFYSSFKSFKYILIYQLDAFVFKDELAFWCKKQYDYIGAPWMDDTVFNLPAFEQIFSRENSMNESLYIKWLSKYNSKSNRVGNGGLSLRNIQTFILVLLLFEKYVKKWTFYEDLFWSIAVPKLYPFYKIPTKEVAMAFSFETHPKKCFELLNYNLPFGCHAWEKYNPDFWKNFINF